MENFNSNLISHNPIQISQASQFMSERNSAQYHQPNAVNMQNNFSQQMGSPAHSGLKTRAGTLAVASPVYIGGGTHI